MAAPNFAYPFIKFEETRLKRSFQAIGCAINDHGLYLNDFQSRWLVGILKEGIERNLNDFQSCLIGGPLLGVLIGGPIWGSLLGFLERLSSKSQAKWQDSKSTRRKDDNGKTWAYEAAQLTRSLKSPAYPTFIRASPSIGDLRVVCRSWCP